MSASLHCSCQFFIYGACKCVLTDCCSSLDVTSVKHADMVCICICIVCVRSCVHAFVHACVHVFVRMMCVCITSCVDIISWAVISIKLGCSFGPSVLKRPVDWSCHVCHRGSGMPIFS